MTVSHRLLLALATLLKYTAATGDAVGPPARLQNDLPPTWDGKDPDGKAMHEESATAEEVETAFLKYLDIMCAQNAWGGFLEIIALCNVLTVHILVIPKQADGQCLRFTNLTKTKGGRLGLPSPSLCCHFGTQGRITTTLILTTRTRKVASTFSI